MGEGTKGDTGVPGAELHLSCVGYSWVLESPEEVATFLNPGAALFGGATDWDETLVPDQEDTELTLPLDPGEPSPLWADLYPGALARSSEVLGAVEEGVAKPLNCSDFSLPQLTKLPGILKVLKGL